MNEQAQEKAMELALTVTRIARECISPDEARAVRLICETLDLARLLAAEAELTKLRKIERCEHCGSDRIYHGPPDCPDCGAPNCCQICCQLTTSENERYRLGVENAELKLEVGRCVERIRQEEARADGVGNRLAKEQAESHCKRISQERDQLRAELEQVENRVDEEWLDAIAKNWKDYAGKEWTTRDGETREEGVIANASALFNELDAIRTRNALLEKVAGAAKVKASELSSRITQYLSVGGLFNPECMDHDKVRDLLMDCRTHLDTPTAYDQAEKGGGA